MPTTQNEAQTIIAISKNYLPLEKMGELFIKLDNEVGRTTDNDSLKKTLEMLRGIITPAPKPFFLWHTALFLVVFIHLAVVAAVTVAFYLLALYQPWYVALPVCIFITDLMFVRRECKLTTVENHIRKKLDKKQVSSFLGYYLKRPVQRLLRLPSKPFLHT